MGKRKLAWLAGVWLSLGVPVSPARAEAAASATAAGSRAAAVGPGDVLQVLLALLAVLILIALAAWLMRRYVTMPAGRAGALRLLAAISVGQRERVVLVQAGETQLLIGIAPGQVRTLHVFDKPVMLADGSAPVPGAERFAERLGAALRRIQNGDAGGKS